MRNFRILCMFAIVSLFLLSCHSVSKKQVALSAVDQAVISPYETFLYQNTVYIAYEHDGVKFYLAGELPKAAKTDKKTKKKKVKNTAVEMRVLRDPADINRTDKIQLTDITEELKKVIEEAALKYSPPKNGTGIVLYNNIKDLIFYRDSSGRLALVPLSEMPSDIEVISYTGQDEIGDLIFNNLKSSVSKKYPGQRYFISRLENIPRVPYNFFDIEADSTVALMLPDFYELKKQMSPMRFSFEFIYSFFVKSHGVAIVKSPFTSAHRLLSTTAASIYSGFSPSLYTIKGDIPPVKSTGKLDVDELNKFLDENISREVYKGNIELLIDGDEFFPHFMARAGSAKKNIRVRIYIFSADPYALSIADLLKKKSNEKVRVEVLTDELNTILNWSKTPEGLRSADYVMPDIKKYLKEESKVHVRTHPNTWATFDHTKLVLVDDEIAYTGGMNFGEDYRYLWHDMMLALEGPVVNKLKNVFKKSWLFAGVGGDFSSGAYHAFSKVRKYKGSTEGMADIRLLYTKPAFTEIFDAQMQAIKMAKDRIYIQNAYFSDNRVVNELIKARERGVDVRVILPAENDIGIMYNNNLVKANRLMENGVRVYMYKRMSHVKAALYDDWACVGTANFDKMSLYVNQELSLGISDAKFIRELKERLFDKDFEDSDEVTEPFDVSWTAYLAESFSKHV
ncbi:Phosphatidylserine/phosphatidylglycerophosphate/cardiolipin synthase [Parelusimicrobium proximum]|uniref:phospholipase D-like domain-containing protein n=1 Tax=Parelusimicrobium proximum TaxID=3228953 RepID=UPI003D185F16